MLNLKGDWEIIICFEDCDDDWLKSVCWQMNYSFAVVEIRGNSDSGGVESLLHSFYWCLFQPHVFAKLFEHWKCCLFGEIRCSSHTISVNSIYGREYWVNNFVIQFNTLLRIYLYFKACMLFISRNIRWSCLRFVYEEMILVNL